MSAKLDRQAEIRLDEARQWARELAKVTEGHREARVSFIRDAKAAGWPWSRMATALGISDTAVRRFWRDNRMSATRVGNGAVVQK